MSFAASREKKPGLEKSRRAKELRGEATPAEACLWEALRGNRLDGLKFRRQQVLRGFIVDFYCESKNLAVELDGSSHDGGDKRAYDAERDEVLSGLGIKVLRLPNALVLENLPKALQLIKDP
jgi:very-short-patch-repair endonuclease